MKATSGAVTVEGKTLKELRKKLRMELAVDGPRGLFATVDSGAEIQVSLYEGEDFIRAADGRIIFSTRRD